MLTWVWPPTRMQPETADLDGIAIEKTRITRQRLQRDEFVRRRCYAFQMNAVKSIPFSSATKIESAEMIVLAESFATALATRRTVRDYSEQSVPREVIEACLRAAGTAPSGANQQPWRFVAIGNAEIKRRIRIAAEAEEREFYERRAPGEWLDALAALGTDANKPFLEQAPWLIAVFYERTGPLLDGHKAKRYYPHESTGIATGLLITALHNAGLATLTHTPSPMAFLNEILGRPKNEVPYLLLVVGHPTEDCRVPDIERKSLAEISDFLI
jgi:nitroreductase